MILDSEPIKVPPSKLISLGRAILRRNRTRMLIKTISRDGSGAVLISCQATFEPTASGSRLLARANDW
jgi:hypothetical protein